MSINSMSINMCYWLSKLIKFRRFQKSFLCKSVETGETKVNLQKFLIKIFNDLLYQKMLLNLWSK